jgi:hypothetical protein
MWPRTWSTPASAPTPASPAAEAETKAGDRVSERPPSADVLVQFCPYQAMKLFSAVVHSSFSVVGSVQVSSQLPFWLPG